MFFVRMALRFPSKTFRAAATSDVCAFMEVTPMRSTIPTIRMRTFYGAILLLPLLASAQKPPIPAIGESIEVSIVNVDVFVTTKDGQRVHGLTQNDFEIFENGVRQPITNFAEYEGSAKEETATPSTNTSAPAIAPPQERTVILFFD